MVKAHVRLWVIGIFLAILVVPALIGPEAARDRIEREYQASTAIFGAQRSNAITERANDAYDALVEGLGIAQTLRRGFTKRSDHDQMMFGQKPAVTMASFVNNYLQTMMTQIYGVFFRGSLMIQWLAYVGAFLIAAFVDGMVQRKVKQETLAMNAPVKFAYAFHTVIVIIFSPLAYLLLPFAVTPWFMPIWAVAIAYPMAKAIANAVRMG